MQSKSKAIAITKFYLQFLMILVFLTLFAPFMLLAQSSSPGTGLTYECVDSAGVYGNCTFQDLVLATVRVTNYLIVFTVGFSVVVIAWAGFTYMTSGGNASKRAEANKMLMKVAIGMFFVIAAWFIVNLIADILVSESVPRVI